MEMSLRMKLKLMKLDEVQIYAAHMIPHNLRA